MRPTELVGRSSVAGRAFAGLLAAAALGGTAPLAGQDVNALPVDDPAWTRTWSPLLWTAELPRTLPSALPSLPDPLLWPAPRIGLFWSGGNPAALPLELPDEFSAFRAGAAEAEGSYRRPLDPSRTTVAKLQAVGWRPFGANAAAIGRVRVGREGLERALSDYDLPYPGSPYVVMDTAGSELGRTEAALEGALGWRLGALAVGAAAGYRAQQTRTTAAPVPRVLSAADPGASAGVVWNQSRRLRVGLHGRWRAHAERVLLYSVAAPSRVYWLQGYFEARPQDVASGYYQRRMERDGTAIAFSLGGEAIGGAWAAFVERGEQEERQHPPGRNDPDSDTWTTDVWTAGAALQRAIGSAIQVVVSGRYSNLAGEARRGDLPDTVTFVSDESVLDLAADVEIEPVPVVRLLARLTFRSENRDRRDQIARLRTDLEGWTTGIGVAVAYRPLESLALGAGGAIARYGAGGAIPDPVYTGPAYSRYVAPELSLAASDATSWAVNGSVLWSVLPAASLWARVRGTSLSRSEGGVQLALVPGGKRKWWSVELGAVLGVGW
jgi:hypothetical protein